MKSTTRVEDNISRARYDRILFAAERCQAEVAVSKHDSGVSKQRRRMLELGAMCVLEAELEVLSMGESSIQELGCSERELESFKSSLTCLMSRHYDNLDGLDRSDDFHGTLDGPELPFLGEGTIESGDISRSIEVSKLLSRLPSLARDGQEEDTDGQTSRAIGPLPSLARDGQEEDTDGQTPRAIGPAHGRVPVSTTTTSHVRNKPHNVSPDGRTRVMDIERIPYRDDSSMSSVKGPSNKSVSPGILYGDVSSREQPQTRQRVEPPVGMVNSPYRMEESIRRRSNHGRASAGGPRHDWGEPTSTIETPPRREGPFRRGEQSWRREGFEERRGGVHGGEAVAGHGNNNPFKTARELRGSDKSKGHARGEQSWEGRDTNHSGYGRERPQQGQRQWDADLNDKNGYKDVNGFGGGSRYRETDDGHARRDHGMAFAPRPPNSAGLVRKRKFVPPGRIDGNTPGGGGRKGGDSNKGTGGEGDDELPEELQHLEKAMVEKIMQEVQQRGDPVTFDQIAGLEFAKKSVVEVVCWPMERPDIFVGLRALPKGLLLFGPPGTGKTLIGKAIAHQSGATFFSISASSLCSKWIGEGEKMVRTLFAVAAYHQPAVIFIDEVDSMLSMRSADENEASRRLKTEFLIQLDGAGTKVRDRVLVVGATNRPQELDEAARRRFVKRLYVPLPDKSGRRQLINILLKSSVNNLTPRDVEDVVEGTEGFSGADLHSLCTEAAMGPVRELGSSICSIRASDVPPMEARHFTDARQCMRPSVCAEEITQYVAWNEEFGSFKRQG